MAQGQAPGPNTLDAIKCTIALTRTPLKSLLDLREKYGDIVRIQTGTLNSYFVFHPDYIKDVLVTKVRSFEKRAVDHRVVGKIIGTGLIISEGDFWARQRRLVQPAFHVDQLREYSKLMVEACHEATANWKDGITINFAREMTELTMRIIGKTLFGLDDIYRITDIRDAVSTVIELMKSEFGLLGNIPDWVPLPSKLRYVAARRVLDEFVLGLIEERRRNPSNHKDLLAMLLSSVDTEGDGSGMTNKQVRDEAMSLFLAGHETSAVALSWLGFLLAKHQPIQERIRAEIDKVVGDREATFDDFPHLMYTNMTIKEGMRLYPPGWLMTREAIEDLQLGAYTVKKGSYLFISQYAMHRDPRFFPEPLKFDPERFAPGSEEKIDPFAYIPFGAGGRSCIGKNFASIEQALIVATILKKFRLVTQESDITPVPLLTLRPNNEVPLKIVALERAASAKT